MMGKPANENTKLDRIESLRAQTRAFTLILHETADDLDAFREGMGNREKPDIWYIGL